jgi:glucosamine--fructose-6-phosphate aminotransferase (isomerizing)
MAREADASLVLDGAVEKSVTTTRSLTSMVLAGYALAALAGADSPGPGSGLERDLSRLPAVCRSGMGRFEELGRRVSEDREIVKYAFLGTGSMYGLAREGQLKFKEMVLLPSDSYVTLDFRHGPMSNVDGGMLVTLLSSEPALAFEREVARDMKSLGGKVFALGCGAGFEDVADYVLDLRTLEGGLGEPGEPGEPGGPGAAVAGATPWVQAAASVRATPWVLATPWVAGVLYMPAIQFMAYYTSLAVGCDPDKPRNLSYYVKVTSPPEPPRSRRSSRSRGAP